VSRLTIRFGLWAALIAMLVWLIGAWVAPGGRDGLAVGAGAAFAFQASTFGLLAGVLGTERPALIYGLGMVGRFLLLGGMALVVVPALGVPPVPTLIALVATLFATTLVEPVFLRPDYSTGR
jgi:hypothetical protein